MQVAISTDANVQLNEPENCRQFSVVVPSAVSGDDLPDLVRRSNVGELDNDCAHVHVGIDVIRGLAAGRTAPGWDENFATMISFARTKGWVDDIRNTVRGHIEPI